MTHPHKGTRKYSPTICLYMCLEVEENWDICQRALMTTTVKLRINQSRCLFATNIYNPAEILPYWVEVLIIKIPKVALTIPFGSHPTGQSTPAQPATLQMDLNCKSA